MERFNVFAMSSYEHFRGSGSMPISLKKSESRVFEK